MKFAKELDEDLVPEWRSKYLDYKHGKRKVKAVLRALKEANRTPIPSNSTALLPQTSDPSQTLPFTHFDFNQHRRPESVDSAQSDPVAVGHDEEENATPTGLGQRPNLAGRKESLTMFAKSPPVLIPGSQPGSQPGSEATSPERMPLRPAAIARNRRYGSFVGTPPEEPSPLRPLELPDPAITPQSTKKQPFPPPLSNNKNVPTRIPASAVKAPDSSDSSDPYHVGPSQKRPSFAQRFLSHHHDRSAAQRKPNTFPRSQLRKMFRPHQIQASHVDDVQLEAYTKLDTRQHEFFEFLDNELHKIEDFYKSKEDEATERLTLLRQQLHELRDRRLHEVYQAEHGSGQVEGEQGLLAGDVTNAARALLPKKEDGGANGHGINPLKKFEGIMHRGSKVGRVTKSLQQHTSPSGPQGQVDGLSDFVRKKDHAPSYRVAKRRLKLALQEYYRGLELLKSYTLLNRTAFRKINKKYDKAVNARPTLRYYSEKLEQAYFVKSNVIGGHIVAVEDLYARYFEKGNHKVAVNKLRSKLKSGDQSGVAFRNGLYLAAGSCFAIAGLTTAVGRLFDPDPVVAVNTSYLMQLYGGYFLALLLFLLFVLDCKIWTANRINYQFIFEYEARHTLDWRQLAELPCFFLFLNGLFLFLNFQQDNDDPFFRYWYVILIAITLVIMALPFKILYYQSRRWWGYSNWRLFFAGFYPVEFRDFYLGDMYCSATYSMSQIELFFCLYVNDWTNPKQCNSGHSRLLGFFATLPAVWRALQCLRRYRDSRNWFPHLANFAKYMGNILYYMTLSMYRINLGFRYRAAFIAFAAVNGLYCSTWDIFMDWSLGDWWSGNWFLRPRLAYKRRSFYYVAMIADVILRQQWIFYAIFTEDVQHQSAVSFFVALAEVLRRGMWSLFRVENEHCNNVAAHRASRDIPLPYKVTEDSSEDERSSQEQQQTPAISATGTDVERQPTTDSSSTVRQRRQAQPTPTIRALQRVGTAIAAAHAQDFEKKRRPVQGSPEDEAEALDGSSDEDDDDEGDLRRGDEEDDVNVEAAGRLMRSAQSGGVA